MDYDDLFQNGRLDLGAAKILFDNECYGQTAFFLQQALEKHVKAFMLKNNVFENVAELKHLPYVKIIEMYLELIKSANEQVPQLQFNLLIHIFEYIFGFLKKLTHDEALKIIIWKNSLQIPLSDIETPLSINLNIEFEKIMNEFMSDLPNFSKRYKKYVNLDEINQKNTSTFDEKQKASVNFLNKLDSNLDSSQQSNFSLTDIEELLTVAKHGTGKNSFSKKETLMFNNFMIIMQSFEWLDITIDLFPHETLSRYPISVDGEMISELYVQYKDTLHELMDKTEITCNEIYKK